MTNKEFFLKTYQSERTCTLNALKALPEGDQLSYRYQPKSRSVKELADHFVSHVEDLVEALEDGVIHHRATASYKNIADAVNVFEDESNKLVKLIQSTSDNDWENKPIEMYIFGQPYGSASLGERCWQFLLDIIHHRGQLSTTYRHLGVPQPSIYGPTAEMVEEMMSQRAATNPA